MFYPAAEACNTARFEAPDWPAIHLELKRPDMTKQLAWEEYTARFPNRVLLGNRYVFQPWRDHLNRLPESDDWNERFERANRAASHVLADRDTGKVLVLLWTGELRSAYLWYRPKPLRGFGGPAAEDLAKPGVIGL